MYSYFSYCSFRLGADQHRPAPGKAFPGKIRRQNRKKKSPLGKLNWWEKRIGENSPHVVDIPHKIKKAPSITKCSRLK
jgi:hypothetical protein